MFFGVTPNEQIQTLWLTACVFSFSVVNVNDIERQMKRFAPLTTRLDVNVCETKLKEKNTKRMASPNIYTISMKI